MKSKLIAVAVLAALTGCSSLSPSNSGVKAPVEDAVAIKDRTITTDWKDDGIKLTYDLSGEIEKIEITFKTQAFNADYKAYAELQARSRLVDFLYGSNVKTERRVKVIARTLQHDADNTLNRFKESDGSVDAGAIEQADAANVTNTDSDANSRTNTAKRNTVAKADKMVNTLITSNSAGRLTGWQVFGRPEGEGKIWVAHLVWERKTAKSIVNVRSMQNL